MGESVGLSWHQDPLSTGAIGRFLVPEPLPKRLLFVGRLRRRMRARFGGIWLADSEDVVLLFEPGRYPVAYFRRPTFLHTSWNAPSIHSTPRSRARVLVQCPSRRATRRAARGVAAHQPARPRERTAGTHRVRLAGHGCFLRRGRKNRGPCGNCQHH
jgi:hypothetical protein